MSEVPLYRSFGPLRAKKEQVIGFWSGLPESKGLILFLTGSYVPDSLEVSLVDLPPALRHEEDSRFHVETLMIDKLGFN